MEGRWRGVRRCCAAQGRSHPREACGRACVCNRAAAQPARLRAARQLVAAPPPKAPRWRHARARTRVWRRERSKHRRDAVHVLRRVLDGPQAAVVVLKAVEGQRLVAAPAGGQNEGVARLEGLGVPPGGGVGGREEWWVACLLAWWVGGRVGGSVGGWVGRRVWSDQKGGPAGVRGGSSASHRCALARLACGMQAPPRPPPCACARPAYLGGAVQV